MPGPQIKDTPLIALGFHQVLHRRAVQNADLFIAIGKGQMFHLGAHPRRLAAGIFAMCDAVQIAGLGGMIAAKVTQLRLAVLGNIPQSLGLHRAQTAFQPQLALVIPRPNLPAIAARRAKTSAMRFKDNHLKALSRQRQRRPKPGISRADDTNIGAGIAAQTGALRWNIRRRRIPAGREYPRFVVAIQRVHTFSSRCSRSHGLITCRNSLYSARLTME